MSERHYLALLGVELRRGFPTVLRSTGTLILLIVIFLAERLHAWRSY